MSKLFFGTILSQATRQIRSLSVNIERAQNNFLTEKCLNNALEELKETQRLLEEARDSYISMKKDQSVISRVFLK
jgi:hypothetical protein